MKKVPWTRVGAEFLVIFVGVTLGLAADDWRQGREDRVSEREYLSAVADDLLADSTGLGLMATMMREYDDAALHVRAALASGAEHPDSVMRHMRRLMPYALYQPVAAAYIALRDGGQIELIGDPELRRRIVEYYEVTQPLMLQFDRRVAGSHRRFYEVALTHFAAKFDPSAESNWPPGQMEWVTSLAELSSDHDVRTMVGELGIDAGNWAVFIRSAIEENSELRRAVAAEVGVSAD